MKKMKLEYIISGLFILVIMFFMCTVAVRVIGTKVFHISFVENNAAESNEITSETNRTDWKKLYPFSDKYVFDYKKTEPAESAEPQEYGFREKVKDAESRIDYYSTNLLFGRMKFVETNALFNKTVGMKIISGTDSVVVMDNGYLTFQANEVNTDFAANSLRWFKNNLDKKRINLMYVQFPSKECPADNELPTGVEDFNNINADSLLNDLKKTDVKYSDFRQLLYSETDNWYGAFFRTDHHWLPETGVWAAGKLAELLNQNCGYNINTAIGSIDNYNVKIYKKYCLGSQGRAATLKFADPEDFSLITPKKGTNFTVNYFSDFGGTGSYEDVLIDKRAVAKIDYYNLSTYSAYLYGNNAVTSIRNNNVHNGKRLLILSDSFCKCVVPILAQEIEYIDVVDRRYFTGSIMSYVEQFNPDTVLVAYNPTMISESPTGMFNFQ